MDNIDKAKVVDVISEKIGKLNVQVKEIEQEITHLKQIRMFLQEK